MAKKSKINLGEQAAIEYFKFKGFENIIHEPDGNIPPDLLLNNSIAVEVRRLNQFIEVDGMKQPVEELEFKLFYSFRLNHILPS